MFEQHVEGEVGFLKIDAENHEDQVLRSLDLAVWRPHVIVAEAPHYVATPWMDRLLSSGYRAALFDGVNRFFVADEHWEELGAPLSYPACSLDRYQSYDHLLALNALRDECERLQHEVAGLRSELLAAQQAALGKRSRNRFSWTK